MSSLPNDFTEEMKRLLGEEYEAFLASYRETSIPTIMRGFTICRSPVP